jgi:hypothetical protein
MNILIGKTFNGVYYIDVDSYQTKSYKCEAVMHNIRDRTFPLGAFNNQSDWFSWSIITFQMYVGLHPYRIIGVDLDTAMDSNLAVFDKNVKIPNNINFNIIPKNLLEYYKNVFLNKNRDIPPESSGAIAIQVTKPVHNNTNAKTGCNLVGKYDSNIIDAVYRNGNRYILTEKSTYKDNDIIKQQSTKYILFCGDDLIDIDSDGMVSGNIFYTIEGSNLIQHSFVKFGNNIKDFKSTISSVYSNSAKMFHGVVVQELFGRFIALIPYSLDKCTSVKLKELVNCRILDASRQREWLFVSYEQNGNIACAIYKFTKSFENYECVIRNDIKCLSLNVLVKSNGVVILNTGDNDLELFSELKGKANKLTNTPVFNENSLIELHKVCFTIEDSIYEIV